MKNNKVMISIIVVCFVLVISFCAFLILNKKEEKLTDAMKFKKEYEQYNNLKNDQDKIFLSINIDENNIIEYKTGKEILEVLKNEKAVVYFGFAKCPWCRNIIEPMFNSAKSNNIDKIYYVDIENIRDNYKFSGSIKPEMTKKGTDAYYDILDFFGSKLEKYYIKDEKQNQYDTGVTRLYAPTVITIENGKIVNMHVATVKSQLDPYIPLDKTQKEELTKIYNNMFKDFNNNTCSSDGC